jgi:hypothetical protein
LLRPGRRDSDAAPARVVKSDKRGAFGDVIRRPHRPEAAVASPDDPDLLAGVHASEFSPARFIPDT